MAIEDTFIPTYFRVTISATGLGGAAPADGFIDNETPEEYKADPSFNALPSTLALSLAKERGNVRYLRIIQEVSTTIAPLYVLSINKPSAGPDADATTFDFTLVYDKPDFVYTRVVSEDGTGTPGTLLTGATALIRLIARAISMDVTGNRNTFNPTLTGGAGTPFADPSKIEKITTAKIAATVTAAEANITASIITNT